AQVRRRVALLFDDPGGARRLRGRGVVVARRGHVGRSARRRCDRARRSRRHRRAPPRSRPGGGRARTDLTGCAHSGRIAMQRLSGLDASFLYLETPTAYMHVAGLMVLDPATAPVPWSFDEVRNM